jgi:hypothetical protein
MIMLRSKGWEGHVAHMGGKEEEERKNAYRLIIEKSEGK